MGGFFAISVWKLQQIICARVGVAYSVCGSWVFLNDQNKHLCKLKGKEKKKKKTKDQNAPKSLGRQARFRFEPSTFRLQAFIDNSLVRFLYKEMVCYFWRRIKLSSASLINRKSDIFRGENISSFCWKMTPTAPSEFCAGEGAFVP